jgi:molybdenum cofactor biosynthesis enzyme MoaA
MNFSEYLKDRYCSKFFSFLEITDDGSCWLCCPAWLPHKIGNILINNFDDIWNGTQAQEIRSQAFNGNWNKCVHHICPKIVQNELPQLTDVSNDIFLSNKAKTAIIDRSATVNDLPTIINFSEDRSCNLRCPSCRIEKILYKKGTDEYNKRKDINDKIFKIFFSSPTDRYFEINVTGSGDPFASVIYREMLENIDGSQFPNLKVNLNTNGVMFTPKNWYKLDKLHENLHNCRISLDAGTKHTYETKTRLGGNWNVLMNNCKFLNERAKEFKNFKIHFDFVVQQSNYKEMKQYVQLILDNFDAASSIHFSKVIDWNTWSEDEYNKNAIWKKDHLEHKEFLKVLEDDIFNNKTVWLGNLKILKKDVLDKIKNSN